LVDCNVTAEFKKGKNMLPWDRRVDGEKIVEGLSCFEEIEECLDWYATIGKARLTVKYVLVDGQNAR